MQVDVTGELKIYEHHLYTMHNKNELYVCAFFISVDKNGRGEICKTACPTAQTLSKHQKNFHSILPGTMYRRPPPEKVRCGCQCVTRRDDPKYSEHVNTST